MAVEQGKVVRKEERVKLAREMRLMEVEEKLANAGLLKHTVIHMIAAIRAFPVENCER